MRRKSLLSLSLGPTVRMDIGGLVTIAVLVAAIFLERSISARLDSLLEEIGQVENRLKEIDGSLDKLRDDFRRIDRFLMPRENRFED